MENIIYRPPSEARSFILQVTYGCARNTCTFCYMYKDRSFQIRKMSEIQKDLEDARKLYGKHGIDRVFLADGDALILKTKQLLEILATIIQYFPNVKRINSYGTPKDVLDKSLDELQTLNAHGLEMIYMGLESGDDVILEHVKKGVSSHEAIVAGKRLHDAGFKTSITLINGLGGVKRTRQNALESARVISEIKPHYLGLLTLTLAEDAPLYKEYKAGTFSVLNQDQIVDEMILFLETVNSDGTIFRANHASNYIALKGILNKDCASMIAQLQQGKEQQRYRPDRFRGL